jgi:TonB dependent receptor/CarboxypepD_reg-like domain/TonB-dependent Receptor Plug Domain
MQLHFQLDGYGVLSISEYICLLSLSARCNDENLNNLFRLKKFLCLKGAVLKKNFFLATVLVVGVGFFSPILGQQDQPLLTVHVNQVPLGGLVEAIESQSKYRLYFRDSDFTGALFTVAADRKPLSFVLDEAFRNTSYHYAIDPAGNVFLTKDVVITTQLLSDIINDSNGSSNREDVSSDEENSRIAALNERRVFTIGSKATGKQRAVVSGTIKSISTGESIIGATVTVQNSTLGAATDETGRYSLELPVGRHQLIIRSIGMKATQRTLVLQSDGKLNIEMVPESSNLKEVVVTSDRESHVKGLQMGVEKLDIQTIKYIPSSFGEADVLKAMLTVPGVKTVGEASSGFNVRGGATDQNLILFNNSTIYNPFHFFGFFSSFNSESIKSVELFKSAIPASYGGRLSSVLKVDGRQGDMKKIKGSAGIGVLTSRLNLEGPIWKDKISFLAGARTTYSNWIFGVIPERSGFRNSKASFFDANATLTAKLSEKSTIMVNGYMSDDESNLNTDTTYSYSNRNVSASWTNEFNDKLYGELVAAFDHYQYGNKSSSDPLYAYNLTFGINQTTLKANFTYQLGTAHTLQFGASSIYYSVNGGRYTPAGNQSLIRPNVVEPEHGLESAIFLEDEFEITQKLSVSGGLRYSIFNYLGGQTVNRYVPGVPRTEETITGTDTYGKNELINTNHGPEVRLSARYAITDNFSVKASYNTLRQYIHMLSNSVAISPTDTWKLTDPNIKPQLSQQYSLGFYGKVFKTLEASVEVYKKDIKNYLDYKSGAVLIMNDHVETEVMTTKGNAYGAEFMIKKPSGKLNGWISYTYSRILLKVDDPLAGESINRGEYYPANYDKPHDFNLTLNQKVTRRFSFSVNTSYSTGRPVTIPIGVFYYGGAPKTLYSDRNGYRIPDYFRLDFSINVEGSHKVRQWIHTSWTFGLYNVTARRNPYSVYYTSENGVINGYKLSILGTAIPYVNFNFKF